MTDPERFRLKRDDALLLVIDVQEKLWSVMDKAEGAKVEQNLVRWLEAAKVLKLPVVWSEQYVKGLGPTIASVRGAMPADVKPFEKMAFSCLGDAALKAAIKGKRRVIAVGIEAHVCVFQTVRDLEELGVRTFVPQDAVLSRSEANRHAGLHVMQRLGATVGSTELFLFDLTVKAGTDEFRAISKLVK